MPAEQTAALYRDTAIVVNVFRDRHHFNRAGIAGARMNPRIYEALACGALVISEPRDDLDAARARSCRPSSEADRPPS